MRSLIALRGDVYGTTTRKPAWRLEDLPDDHVRMVDLLIDSNLTPCWHWSSPGVSSTVLPMGPIPSRPKAS